MVSTDKTKDKMALGRKEIGENIVKLCDAIVGQIDKADNPSIAIPVRGSRNVEFDATEKKIVLGDKIAHRYLFNVGHARKFMQPQFKEFQLVEKCKAIVNHSPKVFPVLCV